MTENNDCCQNMGICELMKQAKEENARWFYQCNFCCCCGKGNNNGGKDPEPGPGDGDKCQCGDDCDCNDCDCENCPHGGENPGPVGPGDGDECKCGNECNCDDCDCKDCDHGGGKDPNPGNGCQCGEDCNCDDCDCEDCPHGGGNPGPGGPGDGDEDPHGELDPSKPGLPLKGEPIDLYVTPYVQNSNDYLIDRLLWTGGTGYNPWASTGEVALGNQLASGYYTAAGETTGELIIYFKRLQYMTGYQMAVGGYEMYMPRTWKLYLSKDGGETWILADQQEYLWHDFDKQTWDIKPGFYNAYKLEVLSVNGGDRVRVYSFRMIGLPTELIYPNPAVSYSDFPNPNYDMYMWGNNIVMTLVGLTDPRNGSATRIGPTGHVDFVFNSPRKARSFCVCAPLGQSGYSSLTAWEILGSNDGENWDLLFSIKDAQLESMKDYHSNLDKVALYRQYRFKPVGNTSTLLIMYFQLYRTGNPTNPSHPYKLRASGEVFDPNDLGVLDNPGYPLEGEPREFFVTPNIINGGPHLNGTAYFDYKQKTNEWFLTGDQSEGATDAENSIWSRWTTALGETSGFYEIHFKRLQYVTGYSISASGANAPYRWNFYVSSNDGQTWKLADSQQHEWAASGERNVYDIEPGLYNAYKVEVLSIFGGQQVSVTKVYLIGLPSEILQVNHTYTSNVLGLNREYMTGKYVKDIHYKYMTYMSDHVTQIQAVGYVDYTFVSKRKARSFSIILGNNTMTGWDILGSNDGSNWDTVFSIRDQSLTAGEEYTYSFDKVALYRRYRLQPKQYTTGTDAYINYFQMYR